MREGVTCYRRGVVNSNPGQPEHQGPAKQRVCMFEEDIGSCAVWYVASMLAVSWSKSQV